MILLTFAGIPEVSSRFESNPVAPLLSLSLPFLPFISPPSLSRYNSTNDENFFSPTNLCGRNFKQIFTCFFEFIT
jgi:hypothetical protein